MAPAPSLLLLFPPGWDACTPGPYLAGPLLKGYLETRGLQVRSVDLNIETINQFAPRIGAQDALTAYRGGLDAMNELYFARQAQLERAASTEGGTWTLRQGYRPHTLEPSSSRSVRQHLDVATPYDVFLRRRLGELLGDLQPGVVGITITIPDQIFGAFAVARLVKSMVPGVVVAAGGNIVTRLFEEMSLDWVFDHFDVLVRNQGEEALAGLAVAVQDGSAWDAIPNLRFVRNGQVTTTTARTLARKNFVQPDHSDVDFGAYWGIPYATAIASRGCYYGKCSFCAIPFAWGGGGYLGNDEPDAVVSSMVRTFETKGVNRFRLVEESLHPQMVERLSQRLGPYDGAFQWEGYARLDAPWFDRRFLRQAARAGLRKVYVGLELLPGAARAGLNKNDGGEPDHLLELLADAGILTHVFVMVGFPGSTADDALAVLDFLYERQHLVDTVEVNAFHYEKHTTVPGIDRRPNPSQDWSLSDPFISRRDDWMREEEARMLEDRLFWQFGQAVPRWTHPIYGLLTPWADEASVPVDAKSA